MAEIPELQCLHLQDVILGNFVSTYDHTSYLSFVNCNTTNFDGCGGDGKITVI